jgi:hypothetical protein
MLLVRSSNRGELTGACACACVRLRGGTTGRVDENYVHDPAECVMLSDIRLELPLVALRFEISLHRPIFSTGFAIVLVQFVIVCERRCEAASCRVRSTNMGNHAKCTDETPLNAQSSA